MEKVIVTGATSFIGRHLIDKLLRNYEVIAIVRHNSSKINVLPKSDRLTILELDMGEYEKISGTVKGNGDIFVHLAWNGTRGELRNKLEIQEENFKNSMNALKCAAELNVKAFISAGSQAEYGLWTKEYTLAETETAYPNTEYGKFKLKFCQEAGKFCKEKGIKFIEPRFFSLYGPDDFAGTMVISVLKKMLKGEDCDLTEGIQKWDFLYIDDAISGLELLMSSDVQGGVYNFGYGENFPLKSYIEIMKELTGSKSKLNFGVVPYPSTGIVNVAPCVKKLKNLGWEPKIDFRRGILRVLEEFK